MARLTITGNIATLRFIFAYFPELNPKLCDKRGICATNAPEKNSLYVDLVVARSMY